MATYYVSTTGSNTAPYDTPAKACTSPRVLVAYIASDGAAGSNVYIANGTYTSADMNFNNANHINTTFYGESRTGVIIQARDNFATATVAQSGMSFNDLTLRSSNGITLNDSAAGTYNNVDFVDNAASVDHMLFLNVAGLTCNFNNCRTFYSDNTASKYVLYMAAGTANFYNLISRPSLSYPTTNYWYVFAGTVNFYNSHVSGSSSHGIWVRAGATATVTNSYVNSCRADGAGYGIYNAGTLTVTNSEIVGGFRTGSKSIEGTYSDGGGNILTNLNPNFRALGRNGYILPCIDDAGNFAVAQSLATILDTYNQKGTFFPHLTSWNAANDAALKTMVSDGVMEVGCHSYSHTSVASTGKIFDVTKAAETITIDRTAETITLSGGGSVTGFKAKTLAAIKLELEAFGATVTPGAAYTVTISELALGEIIDDGAATNEIDILRDPTGASGLEKAEMADPKTQIETIIGATVDGQTGLAYACNSYGCPYNSSDANSKAASIALGYTNFRQSTTYATTKVFTPTIDVYSIYAVGVSELKGDGTETAIRKNTRALAINVSENGLCVSILAHTTADFTVEQWGWFCDELSKFGDDVNVTSHQLFRAALDGGDWTIVGDGTYTRTYSLTDDDYHPDPGSSLLRTGTAVVGLTTDFEGNIVPLAGGYNIGPYNNQYVGGGGLSPGLGLSGGHRPPWWNRRRR